MFLHQNQEQVTVFSTNLLLITKLLILLIRLIRLYQVLLQKSYQLRAFKNWRIQNGAEKKLFERIRMTVKRETLKLHFPR